MSISMIKKQLYPILEFDDDPSSVTDPTRCGQIHGILPGECLIITFFKEVIERLLEEERITLWKVLPGENEILIYRFADDGVFLMHGPVGAPACAGWLEDLIGMGIKKVMFCGGGGVLDHTIDVGKMMVVTAAIRDEGFSYHYLKPSRTVEANTNTVAKIEAYLKEEGIGYFTGIAWTTDAFYRETREKVALRREEGAKIVEMEQAACLAVAQFRGISYGAILYAGDDVSGEDWDLRTWRSRKGVRYDLVGICKEIVKTL